MVNLKRKEFYEKISVTRLSKADRRRLNLMINFVRGLKVRNFLDIGCISEMTRIFTYHLNCEGVGVNISKKLSRVTMEKVKN